VPKQVWDSKIQLFLGGAAYTHLYAFADPAKVNGETLQNAFSFQADVRAAGADMYSTGLVPLQNGPIIAPPTVPGLETLGSVQGEIDDFGFTSGSWATTIAVRFLIVAKSDVSIPMSVIARIVPAFGGVFGFAGGLFGKIRVTLGHENVLIPIVRDTKGNVVSINNVTFP